MTKEDYYAARDYAAAHLTGKGQKVDPDRGVIEFNRRARRPLTRAELKARARAEGEKFAAAIGGGRGVRRWTRDKDGVVRNERGEVMEGY